MLIIVSASICGASTNFNGKIINAIEIDAEPFINEDEMKKLMEFKPGDEYSERLIQKAVKTLYLKNFFSNIIVRADEFDGRVNLKFILVPRIRIKRIDFEGHVYFWKSDLRYKISIKESDEINPKSLNDSLVKLGTFYRDEGFINTAVSYKIIKLEEPQEREVLFTIEEGERMKISDFTFKFPTEKLDQGDIKDALDLRVGNNISKELLEEAEQNILNYLVDKGYYDINEIEFKYKNEPEIDLKVIVDVGKRVKLNLIGNEEFSDKDIFEFFNFAKHKSSDPKVINGFIEDVVEFYMEEGYYFCKIPEYKPAEVNGAEKESDVKVINIHIYEGERIKVTDVRFIGNNRYDKKRLEKQMLIRESGMFFNEYLVQKVLDEDLIAIKFLYRKNGYLEVYVELEKIFNKGGNEVELVIKIDEGALNTISGINYKGIKQKYIEDVSRKVKSRVGSHSNSYLVEDDKRSIRKYYEKLGYYEVEVSGEIEFLDDDKSEITFVVKEGLKARIGNLIISNNDFTKKKVIRRESGLARGDPYALSNLLKAQQNIYRLGYFKKVSIRAVSDEEDPVKDLLVEVEERPGGAVETGVGYATEEKLRGFIEVGHKNLAGYGRKVSFRADADSLSNKVTLYFEEPWLFNHPYNATIFVSDQYVKTESYTLRKFSTTVGIKKDFTRTVQAVLQYEVEFDKLSNVESEAVIIPADVGTNRIHTISPYIVLDFRNDPFNPSKGSINSLRFDYASSELGSQLEFHKFTGRTSHYFPLRRNITLALSLRGGYGFGFGDEVELPINKRFFLGGRNTVRGFAPDSIGPKGADDIPIGGNVMMNYNGEFRVSFGKTWGGILFYDAGNVWAETKDFKADDVRQAAGVGIRYITFAGPISLDIGRKLDRKLDEPLTEWYFTIGNVF